MQNSINYSRIEKSFPLRQFRYSGDMKIAIRDRFVDILVISIPIMRFVESEIVGRLFLTEMILICLLPILLFNNRTLLTAPLPKMMMILLSVWLAEQIATDLIRHTPFVDFIRGWAKIAITIINFSALYILTFGKRRRIVLFTIGLALGGILCYYFNPSIYAADYPWKFGVGESLTWLLIIFVCSVKARWVFLRISLIIFAIAVNLYFGFRSYAGICFLTATYVFFQWLCVLKETKKINLSLKNLIVISLVFFAVSFLFLKTYGHMARQGMLGENARQKYEQQAGGELGLLIGGRSEILVSFRAIMDSPIIGHGSWAKDYRYVNELIYLKRILGYYPGQSNELGLIPTHSHLFGAWVEAGILGAVFWIWVLSLPIRGMVMLIGVKENLTPLFVFFGFLLIWHVLFSPFGAELRFIIPYYIVVMMSLLPARSERKHFVR